MADDSRTADIVKSRVKGNGSTTDRSTSDAAETLRDRAAPSEPDDREPDDEPDDGPDPSRERFKELKQQEKQERLQAEKEEQRAADEPDIYDPEDEGNILH